MLVGVSYLVRKEVEVELTEKLFRELYNKFKNSLFPCCFITDAIYEYLELESGCLGADGQELEFDVDIESWVEDMYDKIIEEEY